MPLSLETGNPFPTVGRYILKEQKILSEDIMQKSQTTWLVSSGIDEASRKLQRTVAKAIVIYRLPTSHQQKALMAHTFKYI